MSSCGLDGFVQPLTGSAYDAKFLADLTADKVFWHEHLSCLLLVTRSWEDNYLCTGARN